MSPQVHSEIRAVRHLPAVRFYADLLGIPQVIEAICPKHDQSRVSDAECVMAMIYNILDGRVALYAMPLSIRLGLVRERRCRVADRRGLRARRLQRHAAGCGA